MDKSKNVFKYENRDCSKFGFAIKTYSLKGFEINFPGKDFHFLVC